MLDMTVEQRDAIKTALLETYFRPSWQPGVPLSQAFEVDLAALQQLNTVVGRPRRIVDFPRN